MGDPTLTAKLTHAGAGVSDVMPRVALSTQFSAPRGALATAVYVCLQFKPYFTGKAAAC
jgi:hypothetical protein